MATINATTKKGKKVKLKIKFPPTRRPSREKIEKARKLLNRKRIVRRKSRKV